MKTTFRTIVLFSFLILACHNDRQVVSGDLYFKLIDFQNFYDIDKAHATGFKKYLDSLKSATVVNKNDSVILDYFEKLKKHKLIDKPSIFLKIKNDSILRVYLDKKEYEKLKNYHRNDLLANHQKVEVKLELEEMDDSIYYSKNLISVKKTKGQTYWNK